LPVLAGVLRVVPAAEQPIEQSHDGSSPRACALPVHSR
jgi:hypothetical protein